MNPVPAFAEEDDGDRRIEEIIVSAEKRESTLSDTSISITAFGESMIENLGIQGADEMINYIPATTRDSYDIRIRGVGRNFRALGGDPGVATYYNGVYSEDFGIASSENGLYDVQRIEVLRGPQGTVYGRNSIGGALNYISNQPSYTTELELRTQLGNLDTREFYGVLSGPLIDDKLAYRLVGAKADRDGSSDGIDGSEDVNSIDDRNLSLSLNWVVADDMNFNIRYNNRSSDRIIGNNPLVTEGPETAQGEQTRGVRSVDVYALGVVAVPEPLAGGSIPYTGHTMDFQDPSTGSIVPGIYTRPGVDNSAASRLNAGYGTNPDVFDSDVENLHGYSLTNNRNSETFDQDGIQADFTWEINDTTQLTWIGGWSQFEYEYQIDSDNSTSDLSRYYALVEADVETYSNELQLLWEVGDKLSLTSGIYQFNSKRNQKYSVNDDANQGRYTDPVDYGLMAPFVTGPYVTIGDAAPGTSTFGMATGDRTHRGGCNNCGGGLLYGFDNDMETDAYAAYTQGVYTFNDEYALTMGIRWAEDKKSASEQRGGYFENNLNDPDNGFYPFSNPIFEGFCRSTYGVEDCAAAGLTQISVMNMFMGAASFVPTGDPNMPITPTCELDDPNCATPLRLQGLPISFADASIPDSNTWDKVTWRVNLDWTPNEDTLIYLGATTGYRSGGYSLGLLDTQTQFYDEDGNQIQGVTGKSRTYDEEDVTAYEVGYKATLLDGQLQIFSSVYLYDYDGYQDEVQEFKAETADDVNVVINAGEARNMGWEIESTWLATSNWTIGGNYSYTRTEYQDNITVFENDNPAAPDTLFTSEQQRNAMTVDLKGNDLKRIPRHKAVLYTSYTMDFYGGTLSFGGSGSYTGSFYDTGIKRSMDKVPSRIRIDTSATWNDSKDRWRVRAFVDNLTDEGAARGIGSPAAANNWRQSAFYLYPRFYGIDVTYRMTDF